MRVCVLWIWTATGAGVAEVPGPDRWATGREVRELVLATRALFGRAEGGRKRTGLDRGRCRILITLAIAQVLGGHRCWRWRGRRRVAADDGVVHTTQSRRATGDGTHDDGDEHHQQDRVFAHALAARAETPLDHDHPSIALVSGSSEVSKTCQFVRMPEMIVR